jgi:heme a synthase
MFSTMKAAVTSSTKAFPELPAKARGPVRLWLALAALMVLLTLSIGGMTRLTNSGLSITEWDPVMGIIPPTSLQDWQEQFDKYKQTYEYRMVNSKMTLDEFRFIYNWEWRHRLVARLVFLAVFIPFIFFLFAGRISAGLQRKILVVLGLIVLQGFVGWLMVQSGLRSDVKVSPYRLALHLGLASLLFAMLVAMALGQDDRALPQARSEMTSSRLWGRVVIGLLFGLILFGALVAGLRGGRTHDTWPLMEGQLIPYNMFTLSPWLSNFFENPLTAQWIHRLLAYGLLIVTALHWRGTARRDEPERVQTGAYWLLIAVCVQILVGIVTVLNQVPIPLGLAHQLWAFGLLSLAIWHLYEIERHSNLAAAWSETVTSRSTSTATGPTTTGSTAADTITARSAPLGPTGANVAGSGGMGQAAVRPAPFQSLPTSGNVAPGANVQGATQAGGQRVAGPTLPAILRRPPLDS